MRYDTASASASEICGVSPFDIPMRVMHVAQPSEGGVHRYTREVCRFQAMHGWEVHLVTPEADDLMDVHVHPWQATRSPLRHVRSEREALGATITREQPDVLVLHSAKAGLVGRLSGFAGPCCPIVYLPHAWSFLAMPTVSRWAGRAWESWASLRTNATVAVSDAEAAMGMRAGVRSPMFVVPNPVPDGWSETELPPRSDARRALGLGPGPLAVSVGRLTHQKGIDRLLQAWSLASREIPSAQLLVIGDGELKRELESSASRSVLFIGDVADPRPWIRAADVFVLASRWEGLSLAMLEAMASARSVVTTDVAGSEIVAICAGGTVVPQGSTGALSRALVDRLSGRIDADAEGLRGQAHVALLHDRERAFTRLSAIIARAHAFGRG